jgi:hypothetical protein
VSDRKKRSVVPRLALSLSVLGLGLGASLGVLSATASAATLVTPGSLTQCGGSLKLDSSGTKSGQANLVDYTLGCDTAITSYTIFVVRPQDEDNNIDQFSTNATTTYPATYPPNPAVQGQAANEIATCEGVTPSDGVNCYAQAIGSDGKTPVLGSITGWYGIDGSIALDEPYCKYLPTDAKAGTPAVPTAIVGVIVTDYTGAEDGPFYLRTSTACPHVANKVTASTATTTKTKSKAKAARR